MSKKTNALNDQISRLDRRSVVASESANTEWAHLTKKYNMPSFELDFFYQMAYQVGALAQQRIDAEYELRTLKANKPFWKKLFRK